MWWTSSSRCCGRSENGAGAGGASPRCRDEHGNLALRSLLVLGVRRIGLDRALPPLSPLGSRDLADADVEGLRAVLDRHRLWIGLEVVIPDGVLRQTALRRDERVLAGVLDAHERRLAQLAGLVAARRH